VTEFRDGMKLGALATKDLLVWVLYTKSNHTWSLHTSTYGSFFMHLAYIEGSNDNSSNDICRVLSTRTLRTRW
jgi:hypothetical protein